MTHHIIAFLATEALGLALFALIRKRMQPESTLTALSVLKGSMERLVLYVGLTMGYDTILVLFGALKIGTRLSQDDDRVSNDYFLIGNLTSVLLTFLAMLICRLLIGETVFF